MGKNVFSKGLIGLPIQDFLDAFTGTEDEPAQICAQPARLIPVGKKDDEMAMTTVFLAGMKYIKEFRGLVSDPIGLSKSGTLYCFTEVSFPVLFEGDLAKDRFDGLLLVVTGGKIKDAAIFEMKQGKNKLESKQIETYMSMAKKLHIPRLVSISNQFVSKPTDYPISVSIPKKFPVALYHYAWKSIMFFANVLLMKNDLNIADQDQHNIMSEILKYFEDCSGTSSFDSMTVNKWKEVAADLSSDVLKNEYKNLHDGIVKDWIQEEKDLALKLSLLLSEREYTPVSCDKKKYDSIDSRIKDEIQILQNERILQSTFKIQNAVSPLNVVIGFQTKTLRIGMTVGVPTDKKNSGKIAYLRKYVKKAFSANDGILDIQKDIYISLKSKKKKVDNYKFSLKEMADAESVNIPKDFEFVTADIVLDYDLGRDIQSPTKIISILENKVISFYSAVMQYFEKWTPSTPKAEKKAIVEAPQEEPDSEEL